MGINLFRTTNLLQKGLQASELRHDVIANNIANADTPGFKASHVEFETYMKEALEGDGFQAKITNDKHIDFSSGGEALGVQPQTVTDSATTMRLDDNNVDIDHEMSELAKNQIYYDTLTRQLSGEIIRLKTAIEGK